MGLLPPNAPTVFALDPHVYKAPGHVQGRGQGFKQRPFDYRSSYKLLLERGSASCSTRSSVRSSPNFVPPRVYRWKTILLDRQEGTLELSDGHERAVHRFLLLKKHGIFC